MNAIDAPGAPVSIPEDGTPEQTRRLTALLEAHRLGIVFYAGTAEDGRIYPVVHNGQVYRLRPAEVLPALYFMAVGGGPELAARLSYRADMHAPQPTPEA